MSILISIISLLISIFTFIWNYNRNRFKMSVKIEAILVDAGRGYTIIPRVENKSANPFSISTISANGIESIIARTYDTNDKGRSTHKYTTKFPCDIDSYKSKRLLLFIPNNQAMEDENKDFNLQVYTTRGKYRKTFNMLSFKKEISDLNQRR